MINWLIKEITLSSHWTTQQCYCYCNTSNIRPVYLMYCNTWGHLQSIYTIWPSVPQQHCIQNGSAPSCLLPPTFLLLPITSILCLPPSLSSLLFPQHLFTEIENLGLMFKASVQLLGRLLDALVVDVIFCLPLPVFVTLLPFWILITLWYTTHNCCSLPLCTSAYWSTNTHRGRHVFTQNYAHSCILMHTPHTESW